MPFETVDDIPGIAFRQKRELRCRVERIADGDTYRVTHLGARLVPAPITQLLRRRHEHAAAAYEPHAMVRTRRSTPETAKFGKEAQPLGDGGEFAKASSSGASSRALALARPVRSSQIARAAARARTARHRARARRRHGRAVAACATAAAALPARAAAARPLRFPLRALQPYLDLGAIALARPRRCTDRCRQARAARRACRRAHSVSPPRPLRAPSFARGGTSTTAPRALEQTRGSRESETTRGVAPKGGFESPAIKRRQRG